MRSRESAVSPARAGQRVYSFDLDSNRTQITENGQTVATYGYDPNLDMLANVTEIGFYSNGMDERGPCGARLDPKEDRPHDALHCVCPPRAPGLYRPLLGAGARGLSLGDRGRARARGRDGDRPQGDGREARHPQRRLGACAPCQSHAGHASLGMDLSDLEAPSGDGSATEAAEADGDD